MAISVRGSGTGAGGRADAVTLAGGRNYARDELLKEVGEIPASRRGYRCKCLLELFEPVRLEPSQYGAAGSRYLVARNSTVGVIRLGFNEALALESTQAAAGGRLADMQHRAECRPREWVGLVDDGEEAQLCPGEFHPGGGLAGRVKTLGLRGSHEDPHRTCDSLELVVGHLYIMLGPGAHIRPPLPPLRMYMYSCAMDGPPSVGLVVS